MQILNFSGVPPDRLLVGMIELESMKSSLIILVI